ncbi:MAG: peptidylprolyl isomerase [Anaerolineaceae bacterium]|nr:peptidylprolyl isomerase [Anaerolineaceae bacterium]
MANEKQSNKTLTKKHLARKQREERQTRTIIIVTIVIAVAVVGLIAYGLVQNNIIRPNHPVAKVGDQVIKAGEFESRVKYTRVQLIDQAYTYYQYYQIYGADLGGSFLNYAQSYAYQLQDSETVGSQVLDDLIYEVIIREEAAARGITVTDEEIDAAMQSSFGYYPDGTPTPAMTATVQPTPTYSKTEMALVPPTSTPTETQEPTEATEVTEAATEEVAATEETAVSEETTGESTEAEATATLVPSITPTPTTYSTEIYGDNLKAFSDQYKDYDFTLDQLRSMFEVSLLSDKLEEEITADLSPIEEQVWARHILVATEEEAQIVLNLLDEGEDWTTLAAEYSTDTSNKDNGGDLGWFNASTMVETFSDAAFALDTPGQISDPVQTDFGWHIIQFIGRREAQMSTAEFQSEKDQVFNDWLAEVRDSRDDIEIFDDWTEYVPTTPAMSTSLMTAILLGN